MQGFGAGALVALILPYCTSLRTLVIEIVPREMINPILILFGFFIGLGHCLVFCLNLVEHLTKAKEQILVCAFAMPAFISAIQIILGLLWFTRETPKHLQVNGEEEMCMQELANIYPSVERRTEEYNRLYRQGAEIRYQYPSYKELVSETYLSSTLKGVAIIVLRNFTGGFSLALFGGVIYKDELQMNVSTILDSVVTLVSIVPFFYINSNSLTKTNRNWHASSLPHWLYWRILCIHLDCCVAAIEGDFPFEYQYSSNYCTEYYHAHFLHKLNIYDTVQLRGADNDGARVFGGDDILLHHFVLAQPQLRDVPVVRLQHGTRLHRLHHLFHRRLCTGNPPVTVVRRLRD